MRINSHTVIAVLALIVFSAPAFASGNLIVVGTSTAPSFINTNTSATFLNLSLNVTPGTGDGTVNITVVNVTISLTFAGNVSGNISAVEVRNGAGASFGSNSTNVTDSKFLITLPNGFFVNSTSNATMSIVVNVSRTAARYGLISVNITNNGFATTNSNDNVSTPAYINSTNAQVQNVHAGASISPQNVDTSVINQSFIYTITSTGSDPIQNLTLNLPSGYSSVNLTSVQQGSSNLSTSLYTNTTAASQINITLNTPVSDTFKIFFTANTSSSPVSSSAFTSTITGSNLTVISTDVAANQTNVTTKVLANVTDVLVSKTVAVVNGTDYWEFNFTVNFAETVSGTLQFKMTNWNNTAGNSIALVSGATNLTTLRKDTDFNTTNKTNVRNDYNISDGLSYSGASGLVTVYLRQIIPSGTVIASTWFTTYSLLFRAV